MSAPTTFISSYFTNGLGRSTSSILGLSSRYQTTTIYSSPPNSILEVANNEQRLDTDAVKERVQRVGKEEDLVNIVQQSDNSSHDERKVQV